MVPRNAPSYLGLGLPELGENASQSAFFLLLNGVDTVACNTSAESQQVHSVVVVGTVHSLGNIVNDTRLEPHIRVVQDKCRQGGVDDGTGRGDQRGGDQRHHADGNSSFGSPVDRSVGLVRLWSHIGVVNIAHNMAWGLRNGLDATHHRRCQYLLGQANTSKGQHKEKWFGVTFFLVE